ncbi:MAG: serine hydroxymethyltransferase [Chloroflexi bacterium]|nr:serine hydroxymethyltransferase [Chloroflexota bacterium]MQC82985.1 serine hydroxymethyltransferase [Chloroflexota bacterium]PKB56539.1 MAG: serine hydroxymethyltransferase [SAR202 cluster bacterium Casp-Chloro-G1]
MIEPALAETDPAIADIIRREEARQGTVLEMIPSENYASRAVIEAVGSVLTNKYAEGYPGARYYQGNDIVDEAENLARDRATELFGFDHANVQPHSGTQANMAVYLGLLKPGDTVMGMQLDAGGHLTHGHPVNASGKLYHFVSYGVDRATERIDYDAMLALAKEHRPKVIVVGATAYPRQIDFARARAIADEVDAVLMADIAHISGLIAGGAHPSPAGHAQIVTSSTHKTLRGPRGGLVICDAKYARRVDRGVFPGSQGGPMMNVIAAKAVMLKEAATPEFRQYARQTVENARILAETLEDAGLRLVSGGTETHLVLVDVTPLKLVGNVAATALEVAGIVTNYNTIPFDPQPPTIGSGVRMGTPALTTRGMGAQEMRKVAGFIARALEAHEDTAELGRIRAEVSTLCEAFPAPALPR